MERCQEKLLALCRICGDKIKDHKRKVHASKLSAEVNKVWQVSVLVDSPSVHASFICVKCRLICRKSEYLEGKIKTATLAKTWYPHGEKCSVCESNLEPKRGRPSKVKNAKLMKVNMTCYKDKKVVLTQLQKRRIKLALLKCTALDGLFE